MKRLLDVVLGLVLALLALPVILVFAVASACVFRAWPFFVQDRVGRDGQRFRFVKLRTLAADVPPYADKYHLDDLEVSRLGMFLRRTHLDELPQLLLVPFGPMSLVGPRPEMPALHARLSDEFATARTSVRPGCTGLWQIGRASTKLIGESPEYDLFYLGHQNVLLDLWILARTARLLLPRATPATLDDVPPWAQRERMHDVVVGAGHGTEAAFHPAD